MTYEGVPFIKLNRAARRHPKKYLAPKEKWLLGLGGWLLAGLLQRAGINPTVIDGAQV